MSGGSSKADGDAVESAPWDERRRSSTTRCSTTVATVGTHATIADQLRERYGTRVDRIEFSIPVAGTGDGDTLRHLLAALRADSS